MGNISSRQGKDGKSPLQLGQKYLEDARPASKYGKIGLAAGLYKESINFLQQALKEAKSGAEIVKDLLLEATEELGEFYITINDFQLALICFQEAKKLGSKIAKNKIEQLTAEKFTQEEKSHISSNDIDDTVSLSKYLLATDKMTHEYRKQKSIAIDIVNEFAKEKGKDKAKIAEVVALAPLDEPEIIKSLVNAVVEAINQSTLFNVDAVEGLTQIISHCDSSLLSADDYVQIFRVLKSRFTAIHQQSDEFILKMVVSLSQLLDVMVDAHVKDLDRITEHEDLYDQLNDLSDHENPRIVYHSGKARQALVRVPNNESKFRSMFRRGKAFGEGVMDIKSAVTSFDPTQLFDAYLSFKEAFKFVSRRQEWYDALFYTQLCLDCGRFDSFEHFLMQTCFDQNEMFVLGLITQLEKFIPTAKTDIQNQAIRLLGSIFIAEEKHTKVLHFLITVLINFALCRDQGLREDARSLLARLPSQINDDKQRKILKNNVPDFTEMKLQAEEEKVIMQFSLFSRVKDKHLRESGIVPIVSPDATAAKKIQQLKAHVLEDKGISNELSIYVPAQGAYENNESAKFNLVQRVSEYINVDDPTTVLLLKGDAGSGKSTFNRFLERYLWQHYEPNTDAPIPFFISLPSLENPETHLVQEHLRDIANRYGVLFTDEEIMYLRSHHKFVLILDAYDEMNAIKGNAAVFRNIYLSNRLETLNAKVVISCRTEFFVNELNSNAERYFTPSPLDRVSNSHSMTVMNVVSFDETQLADYINQYLMLHPKAKWKDPAIYQQHIKNIRGMKELVKKPYLLNIAMDVMPSIVEKYLDLTQYSETQKITEAKLKDEFFANWFERGHKRLKDAAPDIEIFWRFSEDLGEVMLRQNVSFIERPSRSIIESIERMDPATKAKFVSDPFIRFYEKSNSQAWDACPLKYIGNNRWAFLHDSLREYFAVKRGNRRDLERHKASVNPAPLNVSSATSSSSSASSSAVVMSKFAIPRRTQGAASKSVTVVPTSQRMSVEKPSSPILPNNAVVQGSSPPSSLPPLHLMPSPIAPPVPVPIPLNPLIHVLPALPTTGVHLRHVASSASPPPIPPKPNNPDAEHHNNNTTLHGRRLN